MYIFVAIFLALASVGFAVSAGPAELPPDDYPRRQYIDSQGCVFRASEDGWDALVVDGTEICGFPPSRGGGQPVADAKTGSPRAAEIEKDLMTAVVSSANSPGMNTDRLPAPAAPGAPASNSDPTPPRPDGIVAELETAIALRPTLAAGVAESPERTARFCSLLGLKPSSGSADPYVGDLTSGRCMEMPGSTVASAAAAKKGFAKKDPAVTSHASAPINPSANADAEYVSKAESRPESREMAQNTARQTSAVKSTRSAEPRDAPRERSLRELGKLVPPGARYVQLGRFDADDVTGIAGKIGTLGYPIAREIINHSDPLILAGPFANRERLIFALDRIRRSGFPSAIAR